MSKKLVVFKQITDFAEMDHQASRAQEIVRNHVLYSLGAAFVPIPLLDLVAVSAVQLDMLRQLSKVYNKDFKESLGKSLISAITGTTLARLGASFVKSVPGIGSILGGVSMSILSGASTYAVGQVFIQHFQSGGDFFDFDINLNKEKYKEAFDEGKEVARTLENEKMESNDANRNSDTDIVTRLEKLAKLKEQGIVTEAEFQQQKQRLLNEL